MKGRLAAVADAECAESRRLCFFSIEWEIPLAASRDR